MLKQLCLIVLLVSASAASTSGVITGLVTDPGGFPLVGATVVIEGTPYGAMTSARGEYVIPSLQSGEYTLVARMVGRAVSRVEGVLVESDNTSRIDFVLPEDASGSTVIRVIESRSHILRDVPATAFQLDLSEFRTMTSSGIVDVIATQPGVVQQDGELHVRGGRAGEVDYVLDGISLRSPMDNRFNFDLPMSAVSSATLMTGGLGMQYGNSLSGVVNLTGKQGGDNFQAALSGRTGSSTASMLSSGEEVFRESIDIDLCRTALNSVEISLSGPELLISSVLPGETRFSFSGQVSQSGGDNTDSRGYWSYNWLNDASAIAKLSLKPGSGASVSLCLLGSYREHGWNQWAWRHYDELSFVEGQLIPAASLDYGVPAMFSQTTGLILNFDKLLGDRTSLNLSAGSILHENWNRIYDQNGGFVGEGTSPVFWLTQYSPPILLSDSLGFFYNGLHQNVWYDSKASVSTIQAGIDFNPSPRMRFKGGLEGTWYDLYQYNVYYLSPGNAYLSLWNAWPYKISGFVQGSYRFSGGIIATTGMRADVFSSNTTAFSEVEREEVEADPHVGLSPRLSFSVPFSERSLFFTTYGRYFEIPPMNSLYLETSYNTGSSMVVAGNPFLEPEMTTLFELGIRQELDRYTDLAISFYNKDITGLVSAVDDTQGQFFVFSNDDSHGNVQGLETSINRMPGSRLSGQLFYTLSFAKGRYSSMLERYNYSQFGVAFVPNTDNYLDWDQTHQAGATLEISSYQSEGPELAGFHFLENSSASVSWKYGSGTPYSLPLSSSSIVEINTQRKPFSMQTNLSFSRSFSIDRGILRFMVGINNLFNRKNIEHIYDNGLFYAEGDPTGISGNPRAWSPARHFLFSAVLSW